MWFAQQLNSFLNLGECKEYPIMARSKSILGSKTSLTTTTQDKDKVKEQTVTGNGVNSPDLNAAARKMEPAELRPEAPKAKVTPPAKVTPEQRKLEVMKNEHRKNVVPINLEDEIRQRAFELYKQRGSGSGSEAEDWLTAEREVRQRYRQQQGDQNPISQPAIHIFLFRPLPHSAGRQVPALRRNFSLTFPWLA